MKKFTYSILIIFLITNISAQQQISNFDYNSVMKFGPSNYIKFNYSKIYDQRFFLLSLRGKKASNTRISTAIAKTLPKRLSISPQTTTIVAAPAILQIFAYCRDNYEPPQEAFDRL